jgi:hypothetical protein
MVGSQLIYSQPVSFCIQHFNTGANKWGGSISHRPDEKIAQNLAQFIFVKIMV